MQKQYFIKFEPMTTEQIISNSVIEITDIRMLQDNAMGSLTGICTTCKKPNKQCTGHMGYIKLPFPVFVPMLTSISQQLLSNVCLNCLKLPIKFGAIPLQKQLATLKTAKNKVCPHCKNQLQNFQIEFFESATIKTYIIYKIKCTKLQIYKIHQLMTGENLINRGSEDLVNVSPFIIQSILQNLILQPEVKELYKYTRVLDCLMIEALPVPPNSMRVLSVQNMTHAMNGVYQAVINSVPRFTTAEDGTRNYLVDNLYFAEPKEQKVMERAYRQILMGCRVAMSKDTSRNTKPQYKDFLTKILSVPNNEPASTIAQCLTKHGWLRQNVSACRVNMSGRTVAVGDPDLNTDQVGIPLFFAENLFTPNRVNNCNIDLLKALINNFPNYPCAVKKMDKDEKTINIKDENKLAIINQLQLGDIVYVQLRDNDIVLVNRYPSIREESFTCLRARIDKESKALKFSLQVIVKMNADFDGDEMELFCFASKADQLEAMILASPFQHFTTYENGLNIIGGKGNEENVYPGTFHLKTQTFKWRDFKFVLSELPEYNNSMDNKDCTGYDITNFVFEHIFKEQDLKNLNYDEHDGGVVFENGKIKQLDTSLMASGSKFLSFIKSHYSSSVAINILDIMSHIAYQANLVCGSTIQNNAYLTTEQKKEIDRMTERRVQALQEIMDDYYNGKIKAPAGFDVNVYFEKLYQDRFGDDEKNQQKMLQDYIKIPGTNFVNEFNGKNGGKVQTQLSHCGQQRDDKTRVLIDSYYDRTLPVFSKFERTPESEGYVRGSFKIGLKEQEMFFHATGSRKDLITKGQMTAVGGYLARRLNQGSGNIYAGSNGILFSDGQAIVSLQYGSSGYDPRCFQIIKFDKHKIPMEDFEKQYKKHPRYEEMKKIRQNLLDYEKIFYEINPSFSGINSLTVPFKFNQPSIKESQLDELFQCRLAQQMDASLREIITTQVFNFYIYALFFLEIDEKSDYDIITEYKRSLVQNGDPVGMKAALASSQPYTQSMLSAIHSKGGVMSIVQEQKAIGVERFQELVIGNKGHDVVHFQLIGKKKFDEQVNLNFVSDNQTILFSQLKPAIQIVLSGDPYCGKKELIKQMLKDPSRFEKENYSDYIIKIKFELKQLAFMNVNFEKMIEQLYFDHDAFKEIIPFQEGQDIYLYIYVIDGITKQQITLIKTNLLKNQLIGNKLFYNLYYQKIDDEKGFKMICNITDQKKTKVKNCLSQILTLKGIDPTTVYCSNPGEYLITHGIVKCRTSLYTELSNNLSTDEATKLVQSSHVKLIGDVLTQSGTYGSFTRNQYRKEGQRDIFQKLVFEQGNVFLEDEIRNPQKQVLNTILNGCIFGTRPELGTTVSSIIFNNLVQIQDKKVLDKEV